MSPTLFILASVFLAGHAFIQNGLEAHQPSWTETYAQGKLVSFLEDFKEKMKTGDEKLGLPVLEPFESAQESIKFDREGLGQINALLTNVRADGLSKYSVLQGDFAIVGMKVKVNLTWSDITATTNYIAQGKIADMVSISGNGDIAAKVNNFNFATDLSLTVRDKRLAIRTIQSAASLESLDFKITGLFGDDEISALISHLISDLTPQFLRDYQPEIMKVVDEMITEVGNDFLKTKTLKDLLDLIS